MRVWYALAVVPGVALVHMLVNYASVDWAAETHNGWLLMVIPIPFALLALLGVLWAYAEQRREPTAEETIAIRERTEFMARAGLIVSALSLLLILCQWVATFIIDPTK
jgi:hypothetical protein